MKRLLRLLLFLPGTLFAESPFDGTWIIKTNNKKLSKKPAVYLLANGMFRCSKCFADIEIKADGHDQDVTESSYWNTVSVRVVDAHKVELIAKKSGITMFTEVDTISSDGNTLTQVVKDTTEAQPVTSETASKRVDKGPTGIHPLSGGWRAYKFNGSKNGSTIKYTCTTDGFTAETPLGERYDAKFDGKYYPVEDDQGHTMASAELLNPNSVEVTSARNGKIVGVLHLTVAPGGKTIHAVFEDKESNATRTYEIQKEP